MLAATLVLACALGLYGCAAVGAPATTEQLLARYVANENVGNFAAWKATKALDGVDLKVFEVRITPVDKIDGIVSGMSGVIDYQPGKANR